MGRCERTRRDRSRLWSRFKVAALWRDPPSRSNRPPAAVGTLPDRRRLPPGAQLEVDVAGAFRDPDGDSLTYTAASSAPGVVTVSEAGAGVTLTAVSEGTATIRVTATDPGGLSAAQSFTVTVGATERVPFTDDPIVPGVTPIKAVHFTELRTRIGALRSAAGLPRFSWTDPVLRPGVRGSGVCTCSSCGRRCPQRTWRRRGGRRRAGQGTDNIRAEIHSKGSAQALGCPRAGLRARETGGGGRPARFCQEETHVLAEQFGTTEHDGFRGPYLSGNTPEAAFPWTGRSTVQQDVLHGATLISERTREAPLPWAPDDRSPQRTRRTGREPGRGTRHRTLARLPQCDQVLRGGAWG